jgi:hypothetical protein
MARGTFAHRPVLASLQCEVAVTIAAEHVKGGFTRLAQIGARASVTVETTAETRTVDEVVMAVMQLTLSCHSWSSIPQ